MQPQQNFQDLIGPVESAAWLNEVDDVRRLKACKLVQGVRTSSTLLSDTELIFPVVPAGVWRVEAFLQFQGSVTGTQGIQLSIQSVASGQQVLNYRGIVNSANQNDVLSFGINPVILYNTIATAGTDFTHMDTVFATGGNGIALQWAPRVGGGNAALLNTFSWMIATRLI